MTTDSLSVLRRHDLWPWLRGIASHPATRGGRISALVRAISWQLRRLKTDDLEALVEVDGQTRFLVRHEHVCGPATLYTGMFEYEELSFCFRYLRAGDHFVDVGANVGIFTVFIGTRVPGVKITSIEPYPPSREMLEHNCSLNQLDPKIIPTAAGSVSGEGFLEVSGPDVLHHLVESLTNDTNGIRVAVRMLDDVVGDEEVALVKIDVEGGELDVFRGALRLLGRARPPVWIFELNGRGASPSEIRGMLSSFGYELYLLDGLFTPYFGNELPTTPNVLATRDLAAVQALVTTSMQAVPSLPVPVTVRYRSS